MLQSGRRHGREPVWQPRGEASAGAALPRGAVFRRPQGGWVAMPPDRHAGGRVAP